MLYIIHVILRTLLGIPASNTVVLRVIANKSSQPYLTIENAELHTEEMNECYAIRSTSMIPVKAMSLLIIAVANVSQKSRA